MLTIAVSSRALFHMEDGHKIFLEQGADAFDAYMRDKEATPLRQGAAFPLVKKLLALNTKGIKRDRVEVILLSRNSPDAGIRVMHSVQHYGLDIERAVFAQGSDRFRYAQALGAQLFLSVNPADVEASIQKGLAAATMVARETKMNDDDAVVRIAFDGDSVLFSNESDLVFQEEGLAKFTSSEVAKANIPLQAGPFKPFLEALSQMQQEFPAENVPLKIGLVTARGCPAHERVLKTLRTWNIRLDEAIFAGGRPKGPLLKAFGADVFFDDAPRNIENAAQHDIASGQVPYGNGHGIGTENQVNANPHERQSRKLVSHPSGGHQLAVPEPQVQNPEQTDLVPLAAEQRPEQILPNEPQKLQNSQPESRPAIRLKMGR